MKTLNCGLQRRRKKVNNSFAIRLNMIKDINFFVKNCGKYKENIFAKQKKQIVNAKSLLGIYSLDLSNPINVWIETESKNLIDDFYDFVKKWEVEE